jgi:hypothetical protein
MKRKSELSHFRDSRCLACQVFFDKSRHSKGLFCSIQCVGRYQRVKHQKELVCFVCQKTYIQKKYTLGKCCSMKCVARYKDKRVKKACAGCGKELLRKQCRARWVSVCSMVCKKLSARRKFMEVRQYLDKYPGSSYREMEILLGMSHGVIQGGKSAV